MKKSKVKLRREKEFNRKLMPRKNKELQKRNEFKKKEKELRKRREELKMMLENKH